MFNAHSVSVQSPEYLRTPLGAAISMDGGRTWPIRRVLEGDRDGSYSYTAIHFVKGAALLAYDAGNTRLGGSSILRIRRVGIDWLRQK